MAVPFNILMCSFRDLRSLRFQTLSSAVCRPLINQTSGSYCGGASSFPLNWFRHTCCCGIVVLEKCVHMFVHVNVYRVCVHLNTCMSENSQITLAVCSACLVLDQMPGGLWLKLSTQNYPVIIPKLQINLSEMHPLFFLFATKWIF